MVMSPGSRVEIASGDAAVGLEGPRKVVSCE